MNEDRWFREYMRQIREVERVLEVERIRRDSATDLLEKPMRDAIAADQLVKDLASALPPLTPALQCYFDESLDFAEAACLGHIEHSLLSAIAKSAEAVRFQSVVATPLGTAMDLLSLMPERAGWVDEALAFTETRPETATQLSIPAEVRWAVQSGVDSLIGREHRETATNTPRDQVGDPEELLENISAAVESTTPVLRQELISAETDEDRVKAFVRWWCGLPPMFQLGFALVLQYATIGLASDYLKKHGMLPGLDPEGEEGGDGPS